RADLLVSDAQTHKTARNPGLQIESEVFPSHYRRNLMHLLNAKHFAANLLNQLPAAGIVDRSWIICVVPNDLGRAAIGLGDACGDLLNPLLDESQPLGRESPNCATGGNSF